MRSAAHSQHLSEQVSWARPAAVKMLAHMTAAFTPGLGAEAGTAALKRMSLLVHREALVLTYNDVLLLMAGLFFVAVPLTFLLAKPAPAQGPSEAH